VDTNAVADIVTDNSPTSLTTPPPTTEGPAAHSDVDTSAVADTVAANNSPTSLPTPSPITEGPSTHSDVDTNAVADTVTDKSR
jgi:hypothetical protein